jgi:DNA-directed RNA polymerase I, II, and III subunit RPABC1
MLIDRNLFTTDCITNSLDEVNEFDDTLIINIVSDKLGVQQVKIIDAYIDKYKKNTNIIIYKDTLTTFAKSALDEITNIELFSYKELSYNVTKHVFVPKHILLSNEQKSIVLNQYKIKESKMPIISMSDPVCRYYNAKEGQLFKIIRKSNTTGESVYYRIVGKTT